MDFSDPKQKEAWETGFDEGWGAADFDGQAHGIVHKAHRDQIRQITYFEEAERPTSSRGHR